MIKVGILGIAHMHGYSYVNQLKQLNDVEIVGVFDRDEEKAMKASETLNIKKYDDYNKLIEESDSIIIASENSYHKEYTIASAKQKKNILCEKPIATNIEDAEEMIKVCEENDVILQIAFPVRYAPSVFELKKIIENDEIGEIVSISSTNHGRMPGGWFIQKELSGGGSVIDHTVHVVDVIRWALNTEIKGVSCKKNTLNHDINVEDSGLLMMELENGAFMTLDSSWSYPNNHPYWGDVRIRIVGTKGTINLDVFDPKVTKYLNSGTKYENYADNFDYLLIKDFINNVKTNNKNPLTSGKDGLEALRVAVWAYKSSEKNNFLNIKK
ncbi:Gfo/Idh/MocA family protein [Oceanotoga teriensis]|uniref:Gfo/Idh/MocA family protein n=1 Tax=Oceanotoga teriensis TaxID=515440 RepID=UPI0027131798|nr:Gfo/Idh/MocA family oxidoreductase [Oceanotoga teriensis]MDO7977501.1 Gfo/Idh/MocA family oxidoreductase [Oceanotoga teriensis]